MLEASATESRWLVILVNLFLPAVTGLIALNTRLAVSRLENLLRREQQERCGNCELYRFAGRREFDQLAGRVTHIEESNA